MTAPRLSICIPTYDRLTLLREAVASAQAQRVHDVDIVVGDDGCSTELRAWAEGVAATDPRVRYLKTPQRVGLAGNWNFVAAHARGEFVTIIGDDDRLLPDFAGQMLSQATAAVAVVFANHYVIDSTGQRAVDASAITRQYGRDRLAAGPLSNPVDAVWRNSIAMSACAIRTSDVQRLQFKADINTPELEFFSRLARESPVFVFVPEYLAEYRSHAASATGSGLTIDRLAEYLEPIEVPDAVEAVKRNLLQPMVTAGVGIRLERGDVAGARRLAMSRYYGAGPRALLQRFCLAFPGPVSTHAYAAAAGVGRLLRRGTGTRGS